MIIPCDQLEIHQEDLAREILHQLIPQMTTYDAQMEQKSLQDIFYHLDYLQAAMTHSSAQLFADYAIWANSLFDNLGFAPQTMLKILQAMHYVLADSLEIDCRTQAKSIIQTASNALSNASLRPGHVLSQKAPQYKLSRKFLDYLLQGNRKDASSLIMQEVANGVSIEDIYLQVFEPVLKEVGFLWQTNQISVAQEHFCTAATQLIMSMLYPQIFSNAKNGNRFMAVAVGTELHELGIRMVADFMEIQGWETFYSGANTPQSSVLKTIEDFQPHVLGISATMSFHVDNVQQLIESIHQAFPENPPKLMVGGYPFIVDQELWQRIGADGFARNAKEAVTVATGLVAHD